MEKLTKALTSLLGIGHLPAGGSIASLAALVLAAFFSRYHNGYLYLLCASIFLGFLFAGKAEEIYKEKDSRRIVIDEMAGMLLALFHIPFQVFYLLLGFILYRFFDIVKVYPLRKVEKLKGATGVMADDIIAGLYTNIILYLIMLFRTTHQIMR